MPDVFFIQLTDPNYKINFAGVPYPGPPGPGTGYDNVILPLGIPSGQPTQLASVTTTPVTRPTGTGIYGASYYAAAGIYKNLGYLPQGYDGVDNGGVLGLVDDWARA